MSNKPRLILGSLVGAFAIHIAALACSGNGSIVGGPSPDASTATHDGGLVDVLASAVDAVGTMVRDVATKVVDGEVRDAHAGGDSTLITVTCDQQVTTTTSVISDAGGPMGFSNTAYYGNAPGVMVDPRTAPHLSAYACDPETVGTPVPPCPSGYHCETTGTPLPTDGACISTYVTIAADGHVAVACGSSASNTGSGVTTTYGTRYQHAYLRIN